MKEMCKSIFIIFSLIGICVVSGCRLDVPIKEMTRAKTAITRAYEVKADKYDPERLDKAIKHLFNSHEKLKKPDVKGSKEEAEKAYKLAKAAIEKSLPLLAKDTLDEAKSLYDEADTLYAIKFASDEFAEAGKLIEESEALLASEAYWDSYL